MCALAILLVLAWASARTSVYTITSKRIVMRIGIALPMALNIPFRLIGNAALKTQSDGSGDIPVALTGRQPRSPGCCCGPMCGPGGC